MCLEGWAVSFGNISLGRDSFDVKSHLGNRGLTRNRLGAGQIRPLVFSNFRSVTGIDAKLGIPLCTSILRLHTTPWKHLSKSF